MLKRFWIGLLFLALITAGCQGGGGPSANAPTPAAETATAAPAGGNETAPGETAAVETAQVETTQVETVATGPATCTVVSNQPTPNATEQSLFPPVGEDDWVKGPDSAFVTILEYSDFM